jgi:NitT/TauT family transport system substrate-binding protein
VAGCASRPATPPPKATVKLSSVARLMVLGPVYIAVEEGYFAEQGIEIEFVTVPSTAEAIPQLMQGNIDVSHMSTYPGFPNAIARGASLRVVASAASARPPTMDCYVEAIVVRKALVDSGEVTKAADLKGKRLATAQLNSYGYFTALQGTGLQSDDIRWVTMTSGEVPAALKAGLVDAWASFEPLISVLKDTGVAVPVVSMHPWLQDGSLIAYGPNLLQKDPELGKRFMIAYIKGARQFSQGKTPRNVEIMAKQLKQDAKAVENQCWPQQDLNGDFKLDNFNAAQKWFFEQGLQDRVVAEKELADRSFIENAVKVLGKAK